MTDGRRHELEQFALAYRDDEIEVRRAIAALDERRDGEPVTRVTLLVTDPTAETWDVGRVRDLRHALGRHAEELGLPAVSLTLVPESEAQVVEAFAQSISVAHYPIEADKLLVAAGLLVPDSPGRGRPSYTAHRRGVSTAYYAVFHAIAERVVGQAFPNADTLFRDRVRRWISHTDVKTVSTWLGKLAGTLPGSPPAHIAALLAPTGDPLVDADTLAIADGFLELHEKREQADYDHHAVFTRPDTLGLLELARQTVATVEAVASDESSLMFGLIAMQSRVQPR